MKALFKAQHRRFRSVFGICLIVAVLLSASPLTGQAAGAAGDNQSPLLAIGEVSITTQKTTRLPVTGPLSQGFTYYHPGIDIQKELGTAVYPILPGTVAETGFQAYGYGNYVVVAHENNYFSLYSHLSKVLTGEGASLAQDTPIGTIGVTGRTTGAHLHLEVYENGIAQNPLLILPDLSFSSDKDAKKFVGGPSTIPSQKLILPISQQAPIILNETKKIDKEVKDKPSLGIWLPSSFTGPQTKEDRDHGNALGGFPHSRK